MSLGLAMAPLSFISFKFEVEPVGAEGASWATALGLTFLFLFFELVFVLETGIFSLWGGVGVEDYGGGT
jgi:hypothetical protein